MTLLFHLRFSGGLLILLGLAHAAFGKLLDWKTDLQKLTLANRQIFVVHCFYIALFLVIAGSLSLFFAPSLLQPEPLSRAVLSAMTLVWAIRLYVQWFVFDRSLWRGNGYKRVVHFAFTLFWTYATLVDALALL